LLLDLDDFQVFRSLLLIRLLRWGLVRVSMPIIRVNRVFDLVEDFDNSEFERV